MTTILDRPVAPQAPATPSISTTLADGTTVSAITYDHGRSALSVGHLEPADFLGQAELVFLAVGVEPEPEAMEPASVIRRHAIVQPRRSGAVTILFHATSTGDIVTEDTPGAVPVTLIEI